jgi:hypothetical protein
MSEHENRQLSSKPTSPSKPATSRRCQRTSRGSCQRLRTCPFPASDRGSAQSASSFRRSPALSNAHSFEPSEFIAQSDKVDVLGLRAKKS